MRFNPFSFILNLVLGFWIPLVLSGLFCFLTDPQFEHHSLNRFSFSQYFAYYVYFWKTVVVVCWTCLIEYTSFAWNHWDEVVGFVRRVLWMEP